MLQAELPPFQSGRYYLIPPLAASTTIGLGTASTIRAGSFVVPNPVTLTTIGAEVTTIGDAGSVVRLGIYADDGTGRPGKLVLDAGTIDGHTVAVQEIAISQALQPGIYWSVAVGQVITVTGPTIRANSASSTFIGDVGTTLPTISSAFVARTGGFVTGALPATWTDSGTSGVSSRIFAKIA
jgi:hypothetical protein